MAAVVSSGAACICKSSTATSVSKKLETLASDKHLSTERRSLARCFRKLSDSSYLSDEDLHTVAVATRILGARLKSTPFAMRDYGKIQRIEETCFKDAIHFKTSGAWAQVYTGERSGCPIVIKKYHEKHLPYLGLMFRNECQVHDGTDHPNLLNFYGVREKEKKWTFVVEKAQGDLSLRSPHPSRPPVGHGACQVLQLAEAVAYLHSNGVIHGDICPENVLFDDGGTVKLADFGYSFVQEKPPVGFPEIRKMIGEPSCAPPEVIEGGTQSFAGDIYRLGMTSWQLLTGKLPYPQARRSSEFIKLHQEQKAKPDCKRLPEPFRAAVGACLSRDPHERPNAENLLDRLLSSVYQGMRRQIRSLERKESHVSP